MGARPFHCHAADSRRPSGGATAKWAEGIVVAFLGLFLIFQPPERSLGWATNPCFPRSRLLRACRFSPAHLVFHSAMAHRHDAGFGNRFTRHSLAPTMDQRWLLRQSFRRAVLALSRRGRRSSSCAPHVSRCECSPPGRLVAALSILVYLTHQSHPTSWRNARGFGPFLNANQTADLFGVSFRSHPRFGPE